MELNRWFATLARLLVWTTFLAASGPQARADGGALRFWERQEAYELAVFSLPTPLTVGQVDISVLVLDAGTGEPVPDMVVTLELSQPGHAVPHVIQRALAGSATNKLFHHTSFELTRPGSWNVDLRLSGSRGATHRQFTMSLAEAPRRSESLWPWYCWPVLLVAVYAIHQWLVLRKSRIVWHPVGCSVSCGRPGLNSRRADKHASPSGP
jgi:hypothetical protein